MTATIQTLLLLIAVLVVVAVVARRVNTAPSILLVIAGIGLAVLPEFIVRDALADGRLERLLADWSLPAGAIYWVTPPGGLPPQRVKVLADLLFERLGKRMRDDGAYRENAARQVRAKSADGAT